MEKFRYPLWFIFSLGVSLSFSPQSFSLFSDTVTSMGNTFTVYSNEENILQKIANVLEENPEELFSFFSSEVTENFSKSDFTQNLQDTSAEIENVEIISGLTIIGEALAWAKAEVRILLKDGNVQEFLVIFHQEQGVWKILGTNAL